MNAPKKPDLITRFDKVEKQSQKIPAIEALVLGLRDATTVSVETQVALIQEVGAQLGVEDLANRVQARVETNRLLQQEETDKAQQEAIDALVEQKQLEVVEVVDAESLIVGVDPRTNPPKRIQLAFQQIIPEAQKELLGKSAGFVYVQQDGQKVFELKSIYRPLPQEPVRVGEAPVAPDSSPASTGPTPGPTAEPVDTTVPAPVAEPVVPPAVTDVVPVAAAPTT